MSGSDQQGIVIIGAGQAGAQAVVSLRAEGYEGPIRLIGDEAVPPYQRPPLSKKFLAGEIGFDRVELKPAEFYAQAHCELLLGTRVAAIERAKHLVLTGDGREIAYDKLLIATGSRVREINVPGFDLDGVHYLRTVGDVGEIQAHFRPGAKLVVVGGGYIGLEVAAVARKNGIDVTVLETAERVMARVVDPIVSHFYERIHKEAGVVIRTGVTVAGFEGANNKVACVVSGEGESFPCDFVVVGVGIIPNTELAEAAGLDVENGIVVDACTRTSDPDICAAGDCTNHPNGVYGRRLRLESVQNAIEQGKSAAAALTGKEKPLRSGAVVLVGSVRSQIADRRIVFGLHASRDARGPGDGPQLRGLLPQGRRSDRGRRGEPGAGIHDVADADRATRQARSGAACRRKHKHERDREGVNASRKKVTGRRDDEGYVYRA